MLQGVYYIMSATSTTLGKGYCLAHGSPLGLAAFSRGSTNQMFELYPIPGTKGYNIRHQASQAWLAFDLSNDTLVLASNFPPELDDFTIILNDVGGGYVAVNRYDEKRVMDANGDNPGAGAAVTPYPWNGGNNQRWKFIQSDLPTGP
jgi:hypothetical protein